MKIMIVAPYYAPVIGGLENYAHNIAKGLRDLGHDIIVLTSGDRRLRTTEDVVDGIRVTRLPVWFKASNTPVNPLWFAQVPHMVRREQPDVVLAHTPVPFIADVAARSVGSIPFVLTYHNDLAKDGAAQRAIIGMYWRLLGYGTIERADRIITTSRFYADSSPFLHQHPARTEVVPPGVDLERFHSNIDPAPVRDRFPDRQIVLFVSSLARSHAHKGLDLLMAAVARLRTENPRIHLLVVGRGDGQAGYQERAGRLGLDTAVTFAGFVSDAELPTYYAAADVFVLPSTNMAEGFGMVLLEASACGTPVIGTRVGGIPAALLAAGSTNLAEPTEASLVHLLRRVLAQGAPHGGQPAPKSDEVTQAAWSDAADLTARVLTQVCKPRVALIHNVISPYRLALFEQLAKDVNLRVFFSQGAGKGRLWQAQSDSHHFDARRLSVLTLGPVAYNPGGLRRLRRSRFDVLVTNTDPDTAPLSAAALLLARLRRRPVVVWSEVTDDVVRSFPALVNATRQPASGLAVMLNALVLRYRKVFFARAKVSLAFSEAAYSFLTRSGVRPQHIVRTSEVIPASLLPSASQTHIRNGRTFLYVGYLNERKNVSLLIDAFIDLAEPLASLYIAGAGPQEEMLRERARGHDRIMFLGHLDEQRKAQYYSRSDVLVLPTNHDCWGLVVNEAIHYGLAVVVTHTAAASELIDDRRGIVIPSQDRGALIAAMSRLIREPGVLRAMQEHNRGTAAVSDVAAAVQAMSVAIARAAS